MYPKDMKETLRKLFTDHAVYTKFFINSGLDGIPDAPELGFRLIQNQVDIGNAVKPIIGDANGNKLTDLLKGHIEKAVDAVKAVRIGDARSIQEAVNELLIQGDSVAAFISSLNPQKISAETVRNEFRRHNQFVAELTTLHSQRRTAEEIKTFDAYYNHMLMFSDLLYYGLS
jgi:hypothetical protein